MDPNNSAIKGLWCIEGIDIVAGNFKYMCSKILRAF